MLKKAIRYLLYTALCVFTIMLAVVVYLLSNKEEIIKFAVNQLNQQVTVKVEIGNADLVLFKQFPKVSLDLANVQINPLVKNQPKLLEAKHVYVGFNLLDILRKSYHIKLINIDSASLNLIVDKTGRSNFEIIKTSSENDNKEAFLLELDKVILSKVQLTYHNLQKKGHFQTLVNTMELTGNFSSVGEEIACKGSFNVIQSDEVLDRFTKGKQVELDIAFKINNPTSTYTFAKGLVNFDKLQLSLSGSIQKEPKGLRCDVKVGAKNLDIPALLSLMPLDPKLTDGYTSKGSLYFNGTIVGKANKQSSPAINLEFGIDNGSLTNQGGLSLKNIHLIGKFTNGKAKTKSSSAVHITNFIFTLNNDEVKGNASIQNFNDPHIEANLEGKLKANEVISFFKNSTVQSAQGDIAFNLAFKGKTSDIETKHFSAIQSTGRLDIDLSDIKFYDNKEGINKLKTTLVVTSKDVNIEKFVAQVNESDIKVKGKLDNVIPYLFLKDEVLAADIYYQSDFIDLNHVFFPVSKTTADSNKRGFELPDYIVLHAKVETGRCKYNQFIANKATANVRWEGKQIKVEDFVCEALDGRISFDGQVENAPDGRFLMSVSANLTHIDMNQLFKVCNNFGQTELTDKNIKGYLGGTVDMASVWSNNLVCNMDKLYVLANVQLENGELNGFKPLESLSKYIDLQELRNIKFATLKNTIQIKNKVIVIPTFEIKNSALNITMQGTHTLNNFIDYKLKIKLNDLLDKKRKHLENEFNEETQEGGVNLYLSMKGTIDNIKVTHDRRETKKQIKQDIKIEKQNIKEIIKKELGITPENTIKQKEKDTEELEFEQD